MDIIKYYEIQFQKDLNFLINSTLHKENRISIVSLIETMTTSGSYQIVQNAFKTINYKSSFLICYFYSVLLDQAIHSYDKNLHADFDKIAGYPKFVGILSSYHYNFHPLKLLLIATLYNNKNLINKFEIFTKYILNEYIRFFNKVFPQFTSLLKEKKDIICALNHIFDDIKISLNKINAPKAIWETNFSSNNTEAYYQLIDILQNELNKLKYQ